ncbi:tripartite motif-containing protein 64-like [Trichosurus vulpecula]|uniref:tripartite motif-containing protein 64-like n=1 Tax=Trichosurus vulpecula TaxID=9337 RepID=UPI00186B203C|nr:tripartite motif-containing protein 64-like [Trichosurus vulpecula]
MLHPPEFLRQYQRMFGDEIEEEEENFCSVCWYFVSKTITIDCGHQACLSCLQENNFLPFCCPTCWEYSHLRTLQADIAMHSEGEGMCELHREDQKLFCESDSMLLCLTCSKSEDHEDHIHWPIAVAALGYRKMIQTDVGILGWQIKEIQELQFHEKERPLAWAVVWTDREDISIKNFLEKIPVIWEYLKKKETTETAEVEELIMGTGKEKLIKLYQRLKKMEAVQQHDIMEQKKEWEARMSRQSRFLTDKMRELEEKSQKSNVELLQDVSIMFERTYIEMNLKPFIPRMNTYYLHMAAEFLKLFHSKCQPFDYESLFQLSSQQYQEAHRLPVITSGLSETCNSYNFSEEKRSAITFLPDSSGKTYAVYTSGNLQGDSVRAREFLLKTSPPDGILEEGEWTRSITILWTDKF